MIHLLWYWLASCLSFSFLFPNLFLYLSCPLMSFPFPFVSEIGLHSSCGLQFRDSSVKFSKTGKNQPNREDEWQSAVGNQEANIGLPLEGTETSSKGERRMTRM